MEATRFLMLQNSTFLTLALFACSPSRNTKDPAETDNTAPTIEIVSPDYGRNFTVDMDINFLAIVSDSESSASDLVVSWSSDLSGDLHVSEADEDGNASFDSDPLIEGGHTITATAIDPDGGEAESSILVNVFQAGEPPVVALLNPDDDEQGVAGEVLTLEAIVEDPDSSLADLSVNFTLRDEDGAISCDDQPDEDGVARCEVTIDDAGVYSILVEATDEFGQTGTDSRDSFEVIPADEHDGDGDGFAEIDGDCDDNNDSVNPDAPEIVDGIDNNCDGEIDENTDTVDDDGDGFTELEGDCNDDDGSIHPGAFEYLDGTDEDCDGEVDEGTEAYDDDGDCYCEGTEDVDVCTGSISTSCDVDSLSVGDCDDADEDINPGAAELCDDIDNDCDGDIDADDADTDDDADGYSACDMVDCDDDDPSIYPGATETCNEVDDDCNDVVDDDAVDASTWHLDSDGDGFGSEIATTAACEAPPSYVADGTDCNDSDSSINPGATEVCDDLDTDEDCSGSADGWDATGMSYWYLDVDGDGYPTADIYEYRCDAYGSYIAGTGWWDCDDSRSDINPGMAERCDYFDLDEDCDGEINEPGAEDGAYFYRDWDGDGYGDPMEMEMLCEAGDLDFYDVTNNDDCCDYDAGANPDASSYRTITNMCGDYDWDCDGSETKRWTATGGCDLGLSGCDADPQGWRYSAEPDCGDSGQWVYDCDFSWGSCDKDYGYKTQECR